MEHRQYREHYLDPDADGELSVAERRAATEHLAGCEECRRRLAEARVLKTLVRRSVPLMSAPAALRLRMIGAMDEIDRDRRPSPRFPLSLLRPSMWVPAAAAAILAIAIFTRGPAQAGNPVFDTAINAYENTEARFSSNIPGDSLSDFALAIGDAFGTPYGWDFSNIGLNLSGARIDRSAAGKPTAYGLYRGSRGTLLAIMTQAPAMRFPSGGKVVKGIHIYEYKGFSIAVTRYQSFGAMDDGGITCIMVSRLPSTVLAQAFNFLLPS